jgi:hypothetical protein
MDEYNERLSKMQNDYYDKNSKNFLIKKKYHPSIGLIISTIQSTNICFVIPK